MANGNTQIYIIHAPEDESHLQELVLYLSIPNTDIHHAGTIQAGALIGQSTQSALANAEVILLLVSSNFLSSDSIYQKELGPALERQNQGKTTVIPVILRYCPWEGETFAQLGVLPQDRLPVLRILKGADPQTVKEKNFTEVAEGVRKIVEQSRSGQPITLENNREEREESQLEGEKLYLLCDRYNQSGTFANFVDLQLVKEKRPYFQVLTGEYPEQHNSLIERFLEEHLKPLAQSRKKPVGHLVVPKFLLTDETNAKLSLKRKLSEEVNSDKGPHLQALDILNQKLGYEVLLIQHNILGNDWNAVAAKTFQWYLTEFWNIPLESRHPQVLIFINLIYTEGDNKGGLFGSLFGKKSAPKKELENLGANLADQFMVIEDLMPVAKSDLVQWFLDHAGHLNLDENGLLQQLYGSEKSQHMRQIEATLKPAIKNALKI